MTKRVKQMKFKKLENELRYFVELSSTNKYKEDTPFKQKLEITIKRLNKLINEKHERESNQI
jgi:hypothetical protein